MEIHLPGQALEEAAGKVASAAGLSIVDAVGHRFKAWNARKAARNEALAIEEKAEIAHQGNRRRNAELQKDRRSEERENLAHYAGLSIELIRGIQRVNEEIEDAQRRIEWIGLRSTRIADEDPDRADARKIDDDWLKRFFKYAADVDEASVLEVLARGLADAAINNRKLLPPKALDILRHFEPHSFEMFKFCAIELSRFEALPIGMLENRAYKSGINLDISQMIELGLIREDRRKHFSPRLGDLFLTFSYDSGINSDFPVVLLTYVGKAIAALTDPRIRKLEIMLRDLVTDPEVKRLQNELGLDKEIVQTLCLNLLSHMADTGNIDIQARDLSVTSQDIIFNAMRTSKSDPFSLDINNEHFPSDKYTSDLATVVSQVFNDFDCNQLPYLYSKDAPLDPDKTEA